MSRLLIASTNRGKIKEYRYLLKDTPFRLVTPIDEDINLVVEEQYTSFEDNARQKALAYAATSKLITIADDSGLEVDALGGEPGVRSARYAGEGATDSQRIQYLLAKLQSITQEQRTAHFKCAIAIATPTGKIESCQGECSGFITFEPRGENGFGYDPIFYFPELNKTMAELTPELKNQVSHRAKAALKACVILNRIAEKSSS